MQIPLSVQIISRQTRLSKRVLDLIEEKVRWLRACFDEISSLHVTVDRPHRSHRKGNDFRVTVLLSVPGKTLVASRTPSTRKSDKVPYGAIAAAFHAVHRELSSYQGRRRLPTRLINAS
ncbi:MAG: HPF/RaiA family ribosome-associated protein [Deltaproteobacteria bacterium]|nr:HPF/RaiA family ribosome-associated protein [Deltaproteobacteria bacterium]